MSNGHFAYMRPEKGGDIVRVALAAWGGYRAKGYVFVENGEEKFLKQEAQRSPAEKEKADNAAASKKKKKKVMRRT